MTNSIDTLKKNLNGKETEIYQNHPNQQITYFGGIPHVLIESKYRGYAGSEHIMRYWQPISKK